MGPHERLIQIYVLAQDERTGWRPNSLTVTPDLTDPQHCEAMVDAAVREFGRVDVLVNNAGAGSFVPATREAPRQFRSMIDVNLNGTHEAAQACGRIMQPANSIVNIASVVGLTTAGLPQAAYSASKAGIMGLTRDLAQQWGSRKGIRINDIAPGLNASATRSSCP